MTAIEFCDVRKEYKNGKSRFLAVDGISFQIEPGEVIGLVGPNGAGKSTIVKMMCGILSPSSGTVRVMGVQPDRQRKKLAHEIGVMFGNRSSLWFNLPARESVLLMQCIYGIEKAVFTERLRMYGEILSVTDLLDKPVRQMSLGQRVRVELLVAVLHNPGLLILDEPTLGLDVVARLKFREMLSQLARGSKTTVVLTTHDLNDVESLCHRVILINKGHKLVDLGSFLGAGVSFENGNSVKGLTTAAGLWATSGIGLVIGAGMYVLGIFAAIFIILMQILTHKAPLGIDSMVTNQLKFTVRGDSQVYDTFMAYLAEHRIQIMESVSCTSVV